MLCLPCRQRTLHRLTASATSIAHIPKRWHRRRIGACRLIDRVDMIASCHYHRHGFTTSFFTFPPLPKPRHGKGTLHHPVTHSKRSASFAIHIVQQGLRKKQKGKATAEHHKAGLDSRHSYRHFSLSLSAHAHTTTTYTHLVIGLPGVWRLSPVHCLPLNQRSTEFAATNLSWPFGTAVADAVSYRPVPLGKPLSILAHTYTNTNATFALSPPRRSPSFL